MMKILDSELKSYTARITTYVASGWALWSWPQARRVAICGPPDPQSISPSNMPSLLQLMRATVRSQS